MRKYAVVIEHGENNLSAYVPDLSGCITTGRTVEEVEHNIREAIELHLEGLLVGGEPIPVPDRDKINSIAGGFRWTLAVPFSAPC